MNAAAARQIFYQLLKPLFGLAQRFFGFFALGDVEKRRHRAADLS
jgi:hypothetical protein